MKWNEEELQCQIFIDVDCSIFDDKKNMNISNIMSNPQSGDTALVSGATLSPSENKSLHNILNPKWDGCLDDPVGAREAGYDPNYFSPKIYKINNLKQDELNRVNESKECPDITLGYGINHKTRKYYDCDLNDEYKLYCPRKCNACSDKWWDEHGILDIHSTSIPNYQLIENDDGDLILNMSALSPEDTLSASKLVHLPIDDLPSIKIKKQFCTEIRVLMLHYSRPGETYQIQKKEKSSEKLNEANQEQNHIDNYDINSFMLDYWRLVTVLGGLLFIGSSCLYACCKLKQATDDMKAVNTANELRENPNLHGVHPSQRNIESSIANNSGNHSNVLDSGVTTNFLPYPNSGTCYQAPCTNPA